MYEELFKEYDKLDDMWTELDHMKGRIYLEINCEEKADKICNKIYKIQKDIEELKSFIIHQIPSEELDKLL